MTHLTTVFGEHEGGDYHVCNKCGNKTLLICAGEEWSVDSEPYKAGEEAEDAPDYVTISAEVTGHFCETCGLMTSLSFNQREP